MSCGGVHGEVADAEGAFWFFGGGSLAAQVGAEGGREHGEGEGFDEVVVGSGVEAGDDVDLIAAGGEDDDEQAGELPAQSAGEVDAVGVGQAEVQESDV